MEDALLLDIEPERREFLPKYLDKYIIADDVTIVDWSDRLSAVAVEGPKAHEVLRSAGAAEVPDPGKWVPWASQMLAAISATGSAGYRAYVPAQEKDAFVQSLLLSGAVKATAEEARIVRLENARPRFGEELTDAHIPHETRALHALHFSKGCYLGQEIVERVRSRGHANRLLVQLRIATDHPPAPGTKIQAGGAEAGEIASAAYSPAIGAVIAMGYVRGEHVTTKPAMEVSGSDAEITERQPN
jgi:aminomethyltransferase